MVFPDGPPAVAPGLLYECAIELLGDVWLYCAAELRFSKSIHSGAKQLIGARFNKLSPAQARLVGHCVSELEREYVRKRVAG